MVRTKIWFKAVLAVLMCAGWVSAASATVIFSDNFDSAASGSILNWDGGSNWNVTNGTVDLVSNSNPWGITCLGGAGYCVDMDGSTDDAGSLISMNLGPLGPGDYQFSYWLSGNQRNSDRDVTVALARGDGSLLTREVHRITGDTGWTMFTDVFTLTAASTNPVRLRFNERGGDNIGTLLDNVSLTKTDVPEPAPIAVLALGMALLLGLRRNRVA